jgi:hypothetical protein
MFKKNLLLLMILVMIIFLVISWLNPVLAQGRKKAGDPCSSNNECEERLYCIEDPCSVNPNPPKICGRPLEICYPSIGGFQPKVVEMAIPSYINYIFRFAVAIIGFIILGALIYSGVSYFFSFGNPQKLIDAKEGIVAAFVGGTILLAAFIIFNSINPQLTVLETPSISSLYGVQPPGIYICNYNVTDGGYLSNLGYNNLSNLLKDYGEFSYPIGDAQARERILELQNKATKALAKLIIKEDDPSKTCQKINTSTNLSETFLPRYTIFAIPKIQLRPNAGNPNIISATPIYEYAVSLFEGSDFVGKNLLVSGFTTTRSGNDSFASNLYSQFPDDTSTYISNNLPQGANSVLLIKKPEEISNGRITLHSCYNEGSTCPYDSNGNPIPLISQTINIGGTVDVIWKDLARDNNFKDLVNNTRSIYQQPNDFIVYYSDPSDREDGNKSWVFFNKDLVRIYPESEICSVKKPGSSANTCPGGWATLTNIANFFTGVQRECVPCISSLTIIRGIKI